ncbi:hypothetical protein ACPWSR_03245 [Alloiococcus sp. CFN-8]
MIYIIWENSRFYGDSHLTKMCNIRQSARGAASASKKSGHTVLFAKEIM